MKVVCVKQPWAWLIFHGKDIENRTWATTHRGPLLIAASGKRPPRDEMAEAILYARARGVVIPIKQLRYGAVIGVVDLVNCVRRHDSRWFMGPLGWILANQIELPSVPIIGQLGLFDAPADVVERLRLPL